MQECNYGRRFVKQFGILVGYNPFKHFTIVGLADFKSANRAKCESAIHSYYNNPAYDSLQALFQRNVRLPANPVPISLPGHIIGCGVGGFVALLRAYKTVVRNAKVSLAARAVFSIVKSYANSDGTHCFPSIETIKTDAGCSRRMLQNYLTELRKAGLIHTEQRRTKTGQRKSTCIFLLYDDKHAAAAVNHRKPLRASGCTQPANQVARRDDPKIVDITEGMRIAF